MANEMLRLREMKKHKSSSSQCDLSSHPQVRNAKKINEDLTAAIVVETGSGAAVSQQYNTTM